MLWGDDMPAVNPAATVAPAGPIPPGATNEKKNGWEADGSENRVDEIGTKKNGREKYHLRPDKHTMGQKNKYSIIDEEK